MGGGANSCWLGAPTTQLSVCTFLVLGFLAWQGQSGVEPKGEEEQMRR